MSEECLALESRAPSSPAPLPRGERGEGARARRLHVAVVDEELPYPPTSGKRIRTLNLLVRLARRHRISYFCHRNHDPAEAREAAAFCRDQGIEPHCVERVTPMKSVLARGPRFYAGLLANLFSPLPYVVKVNYSAALRHRVEEYAANHAVDVWQCEWTPYLEMLRGLGSARRVVVAHNVESLIWQRYHETEPHWLKRWYIRRQWRKFERYERWAFAAVDRLVTVSGEDARLAGDRFAAPRVAVVDNGVDTNYIQPSARPRRHKDLLFLGSLDWRPNLDAVRLLLDDLFPKLRALESEARLFIVGRNPPAWLAPAVQQTPGVSLAANVADVRPYLAACGIMVVPLRIGGGSRLKILEALAAEMPVVSTRVGAEGLHLEAGHHLAIVDQVADLVPVLVEHMRRPEPILEMARAGGRQVRERYDWDALADRLEQVWIDCATSAQG